MSFNFPPSSPIYSEISDRETDEYAKENTVFKKHLLKAKTFHPEYPTPDPSSVLGSSSPPHENYGPKVVQFNIPAGEEYHAIDDTRKSLEFVDLTKKPKFHLKLTRTSSKRKHVLLPVDGLQVTIGRSSLCDVVLTDPKNLVSRKHASLHYDGVSESVVVKCFGVNALEIQIPTDAKVKYLGERKNFELVPENVSEYSRYSSLKYKYLVQKGLTTFPRGLKLNDKGSKFFVLPNEVLKIPKMANIVLDIRGMICHVEVASADDPDLTDDEPLLESLEVELSKDQGRKAQIPAVKPALQTPSRALIEESEVIKPNISLPVSPAKVTAPQQSKIEKVASTPSSTPSKPAKSMKPAPVTPKKRSLNEDSSSKKVKLEDMHNNVLKPVSGTKLNQSATMSLDKIKTMMNIETKKKPKAAESHAKNATEASDSDSKKKSYDYQDPKTLIDEVNKDVVKKQQSLLEIENLAEIKKVLINHLAFSRLASTPLTHLKGISKKLDCLSKKQFRLVLSDIKCAGVIYRLGKDAAGKPLDEEYYYDMEQDDDEDRVQMVNSVKGGSSLRSCRKTHKQYYWKRPPPLPRY